MLSALLPGIREARTPLVVGGLWFAVFWMWWGEDLASNASILRLARQLSLTGIPFAYWFGVVTLAAYLFGSMLIARSSPVSRVVHPIRRRLLPTIRKTHKWLANSSITLKPGIGIFIQRFLISNVELEEWLNGVSPTRWIVHDYLVRVFNEQYELGRVPVCSAYGDHPPIRNPPAIFEADIADSSASSRFSLKLNRLLTDFEGEVLRDENAIAVRIQLRHSNLYSDINRLRSEGELRYSIFWPLVVLIFSVSVEFGAWFAGLLLIPVTLALQGRKRIREAQYRTWSAVAAGEVTSPSIDKVRDTNQKPQGKLSAIYKGIPEEPLGR